MTRICEGCGVEFTPRKTAPRIRHCGDPECKRKSRKPGHHRTTPDSRWSTVGTVTLVCAHCGTEFERTRHRIAVAERNCADRGLPAPKHAFCCVEHYHAWTRRANDR